MNKKIKRIKRIENLKDRRIAILECKLEYQRKRILQLLQTIKYKDGRLKKYDKLLSEVLELIKENKLV